MRPVRHLCHPLARKVLWDKEGATVYGLWPLGGAVCGHKGITHGGLSALAIDEMCGQV